MVWARADCPPVCRSPRDSNPIRGCTPPTAERAARPPTSDDGPTPDRLPKPHISAGSGAGVVGSAVSPHGRGIPDDRGIIDRDAQPDGKIARHRRRAHPSADPFPVVGHRDGGGVGRARLGLDVQLDAAVGPDELAQLVKVRGCRLPVEHALIAAAAGPNPPTVRIKAFSPSADTVIAAEQPGEPILQTHYILLTGLPYPSRADTAQENATLVTHY